jgi:hypothetical protein
MNALMLFLPVLIGGSAALIFGFTMGANALAKRAAHRIAVIPHFTRQERARLRALRERYRREPDRS